MDGNRSGSQRFDLTFDDVCDCIFEIFDENKRFCRYPIDYRLLADTDMGHVKSYVEHPVGSVGYRFSRMRERVGVKSLLEHMLSDGRVRNDDAVMTILQAFHENAHVWQHSVGYMQPPERSTFEMDHMARMHVISAYVPEYGKMAYKIDPAEIMANQYACSKIRGFVNEKASADPRYACLDVDGPVVGFCNRLYGMSWLNVDFGNTAENAADALSDMFVRTPGRKVIWPDTIKQLYGCTQVGSKMQALLDNEGLMSAVFSAETGVEESDALCKYVGNICPEALRSTLSIRNTYLPNTARGKIERMVGIILHVEPQEFMDLYNFDDKDGPDGLPL